MRLCRGPVNEFAFRLNQFLFQHCVLAPEFLRLPGNWLEAGLDLLCSSHVSLYSVLELFNRVLFRWWLGLELLHCLLIVEQLCLLVLNLGLQFLDCSFEFDDMLFFVVDFLHDVFLAGHILLHQLHLAAFMCLLPLCSQLFNLHSQLVQFVAQFLLFIFVGCDQCLLLGLGLRTECW